MTTWNYRIVRYRNGQGFGLHEVQYRAGAPVGMTAEPVTFVCDEDEGPEAIRTSLEQALRDAAGSPVFDAPEG